MTEPTHEEQVAEIADIRKERQSLGLCLCAGCVYRAWEDKLRWASVIQSLAAFIAKSPTPEAPSQDAAGDGR